MLLDLSEEERREIHFVQTQILQLTERPEWPFFVKAVEALIALEMPRVSEIQSQDDAIKLASKSVYVAGMRRVLQIPRQAQEQLEVLKEGDNHA